MKMTAEAFGRAMIRYSQLQPYCAPNFNEQFVVSFWFEQLGDVQPEVLATAFKSLVQGSRFPSLNDVKQACGLAVAEPVTQDSVAREVADTIAKTIKTFGSQKRWPEISERLGEIGLEVIGGQSGYYSACNEIQKDSDMPTYRAQWRELAKAKINLKAAGKLNQPLSFPENNSIGKLVEGSFKI